MEHEDKKPKRKHSRIRVANAVVATVITLVFTCHALMGGISSLAQMSNGLAWLVWFGVALIAVHVVLCVGTSAEQLRDTVRPPSSRKKRHLLLKWITGGLLLVVAAVHICCIQMFGAESVKTSATGVVLLVALAAIVAVHLCYGAKSLLKDLNIDRRYRMVFRVVVCVAAAAASITVILGFLV